MGLELLSVGYYEAVRWEQGGTLLTCTHLKAVSLGICA